MLKRELIRILAIAILGFVFAIFNGNGYEVMPIYFVGVFYAGRELLALLGMIFKGFVSSIYMGLFTRSIIGTILSIVLIAIGLTAILTFGWIYGLFKCVYSLYTAYQLDKQCSLGSSRYYY